MVFFTALLMLLLFLVSIPVVFFCIEVAVGVFAKDRNSDQMKVSADISSVIIIPAHNEAGVIGATLKLLLAETEQHLDRVLVVADNCSDDTAQLVRSAGVEVIEREDADCRGKGYALSFAMNYLQVPDQAPNVIIIFDADCHFSAGSLRALKEGCHRSGKPVQSAYRLLAPEGAGIGNRISEFAIRVKNLVRNRGLSKMGFPAVLTGTGMAFPFQALARVDLASGELAEDMKLGIDLTLAGYPAQYLGKAEVLSVLPQADAAIATQRERWEHGHLTVMKTYLPRLLKSLFATRNWQLTGVFFDLLIPPLSLLVMITSSLMILALVVSLLTGSGLLALYAVVLLVLVAVFTAIAWWHHGRDLLTVSDFLKLPFYVLKKLGLYKKFFVDPQKAWVRTSRDITDKDQ
ncbi:glycosyltransferase family 2 protein [Nitrincola sp.]|uniref:glycosyltransferase family 2 protein n=1 Tax=Nitrincola sp. TaxID=1926584 RepID=UPI003A927AF5